MEAAIGTLLIFLGVIAISAVLFSFWLVWEVLRLTGLVVWRITARLLSIGKPGTPVAIESRPADVIVCPNPRCKGENPTVARFCRRCGSEMPRAQHALTRRAAMF